MRSTAQTAINRQTDSNHALDLTAGLITELVIIDPSVSGWEFLAADIGSHAVVKLIDPSQLGLPQILALVNIHRNLTALHLVCHAGSGVLQLGSGPITETELRASASVVAAIGEGLARKADILIYGCELAAGESGVRFIQALAEMTGANVAAASVLIGAKAQGGNWLLDVHAGAVSADIVFSAHAQANYSGVLAVLMGTINFLQTATDLLTAPLRAGDSVTVFDPISVTQLVSISNTLGAGGNITINTVADTVANLKAIPVNQNLQNAFTSGLGYPAFTVIDLATVAQINNIFDVWYPNTGTGIGYLYFHQFSPKLSAQNLKDTAANLVLSNFNTPDLHQPNDYITLGSNITVTDSINIADLSALKAKISDQNPQNGISGTLSYSSIKDSIANFLQDKQSTNPFVNAPTQITVVDNLSNLQVDKASLSPFITPTTKVIVADTLFNLHANSDAAIKATGNVLVTADPTDIGSLPTVAQLAAIDALTTGSVSAMQIQDSIAHLLVAGKVSSYITSDTNSVIIKDATLNVAQVNALENANPKLSLQFSAQATMYCK